MIDPIVIELKRIVPIAAIERKFKLILFTEEENKS